MTFWDGTGWAAEAAAADAPGRTAGGRIAAGAEATLLALLLIVAGVVASVVYGPVGVIGQAAAARGSIHVADGTFGSTTTATVNPGGDVYVRARCYQDGVHVYEQYVPVDADNQAVLQLGPTPLWSGGAAECTAEEGKFGRNQRWRTVAKTTFRVSA